MNRYRPTVFGVLLVIGLFVSAPAGTAAQAETGTITGRVTDRDTGEALPGASVALEGTVWRTAVDRTGRFRLGGVPAGSYLLVASYLGHAEARVRVTVAGAGVAAFEIELTRTAFTDEVTVVAEPIQEGQARALNQQRTAVNIMNIVSADQIGQFPDLNAAEATQRIPGISIERDQGEGRYVLVRGTAAQLNSMMINGERIPSPEGGVRAVALDVIPSDLLQAIEVSKAVTPDMDADAIGGAVNLITKQAPEVPRALFTLGGGFNPLMSDWGQGIGSFTIGRRINDGRAGLVLSGSATTVNRGSDNFEAAYDGGNLDGLEVRDYTVNRQRYGINGALDFRPAPNSTYWVRGIWNRFSDQEYRRTSLHLVSDGEIERELKDRLETQSIASASFGGNRLTARGWTLDFNVAGSYAEEDEPDAFYTVFVQENVAFDPNVTAASIDPDNVQANPLNENAALFELDGFSAEDNFTSDREFVGGVNLRVPVNAAGSSPVFLKVGAKVRAKTKGQDTNTTAFEIGEALTLSSLADSGFDPGTFLGGRYEPGTHVDPGLGRALRDRPDVESEFDFESNGSDFDASEQVVAGYAMAELYLGPQLLILPGVRIEATRLDYTGHEVIFDEEGDYADTLRVSGDDSYAQILPGVHLRYAINPDTNFRVALTRTLARPNYEDLVPYRFVIQEDREVEMGNTSLQPTTSWNVDVLAERYLSAVGVVSGGVFYKRLDDYIFPFTFSEDLNGVRYEFHQPQNGQYASLAGAEVAYQSQLRFLPAPFDGLGLYLNYTFADSSATFPGRDETATLPGQSRHVGNAAVWFEKRGFSARASMNFHGRYVSAVGESIDEDEFYDTHRQLDVSISQALNPRVRLFVDLVNLTNEPLRYYRSVPTRPIQEEYYRWSATFGVKSSF